LFRKLGGRIRRGVGIEPTLRERIAADNYELLPGTFPGDAPTGMSFNVITMLAVLEHIPEAQHADVADSCARLLRPGGRAVITVPSPRVDRILRLLIQLRVVSGMAAHEHHGFEPEHTLGIFTAPRFRLLARKTFQLRLNNLFVFERVAGDTSQTGSGADIG
jgi:SAM-dependent methyltransferase